MERISEMSPRSLARIAGGLYLINIVFGFFAIGFIPGMLVVAGDPGASAHNIQTHELLYRSGLVAHIIVTATNVPLQVIFYDLFKVVNRRLALLVVLFSVVGTASEVALIAQQVPASTSIDLQGIGYDLPTVFYGFYAITIGFLIFNSNFLPRAIGVLMVIDGLAYITNSFADILSPGFAAHLVPYIQLPALLGEGSFCLWLLLAGVNVERWRRHASLATSRVGLAQ